MQLTNSPTKIPLPFASSGLKNTIPEASQIGITAGAASLTDGFPPLTYTPLAAGGQPIAPGDMNGILFELSAVIRWANAGGGYAYDSAFATDSNVGGYPKGARVMRSDGLGYWFNTSENNTTDPEGVGAIAAGWVPDFTTGATAITMTSSSVTLTALQYGKPIIIISGLLTANLNLIFPNIVGSWIVINNTTGAFSITCKTAAGTGVIAVTTLQIVGDGTNIYEANASAGASIRGAFKNLQSSATGTSAVLSVSADELVVENSSHAYVTLRSLALTASTGSASGTANSLDTGAWSFSTWYNTFVIWNGTTASLLWSLSATAPALPGGYTHFARVGTIRTPAATNYNPLGFKQRGRKVSYVPSVGSNLTSLPNLVTSAIVQATYAAVGTANLVPPTASEISIVASGAQNSQVAIAPNNSYSVAGYNGSNPAPIAWNGAATSAASYMYASGKILLESTNIYWSQNTSTAMVGTTYINVYGWEDNL